MAAVQTVYTAAEFRSSSHAGLRTVADDDIVIVCANGEIVEWVSASPEPAAGRLNPAVPAVNAVGQAVIAKPPPAPLPAPTPGLRSVSISTDLRS